MYSDWNRIPYYYFSNSSIENIWSMTRAYVDVTQIGYTSRNWVRAWDGSGEGTWLLVLHIITRTIILYTCNNNKRRDNHVVRTIIPCTSREAGGRRTRPHCVDGLGVKHARTEYALARPDVTGRAGTTRRRRRRRSVVCVRRTGRGRGGNCFLIPHSQTSVDIDCARVHSAAAALTESQFTYYHTIQ